MITSYTIGAYDSDRQQKLDIEGSRPEFSRAFNAGSMYIFSYSIVVRQVFKLEEVFYLIPMKVIEKHYNTVLFSSDVTQ